MFELIKRYFFYLARWQLSTPLLAACVYLLTKELGPTLTTVIANFIGGLIFFWVDQWIFKKTDILFTGELWEIKYNIVCADCQKTTGRGFRLVRGLKYDKSRDRQPQFRCHDCSDKKYAAYKNKIEQDSKYRF